MESLLIKNTIQETQDLIISIKNRDIKSFGFLYEQYSPALYSWILSKMHDVKTSETILENSFLSIWQTIDLYDPARCSFFIWMLQVSCKEMSSSELIFVER